MLHVYPERLGGRVGRDEKHDYLMNTLQHTCTVIGGGEIKGC